MELQQKEVTPATSPLLRRRKTPLRAPIQAETETETRSPKDLLDRELVRAAVSDQSSAQNREDAMDELVARLGPSRAAQLLSQSGEAGQSLAQARLGQAPTQEFLPGTRGFRPSVWTLTPGESTLTDRTDPAGMPESERTTPWTARSQQPLLWHLPKGAQTAFVQLKERQPRSLETLMSEPVVEEQGTDGGAETSKAAARRASESGEILASLGPGQPLPKAIQQKMETLLGVSLAHVRIHTDARAAQLVTGLGARALTFGHAIAFAEGEFRPDSADGQALLAHELTHVKQQAAGRVQGPETVVQDAGLEAEADVAAQKVAQGPVAGAETVAAEASGADSETLAPPSAGVAPSREQLGADERAETGLRPGEAGETQGGMADATLQTLDMAALPAIQLWSMSGLVDGAANLVKQGAAAVSDFVGDVGALVMGKVAGFLRNIPGYDLLALVLGRDPLSGKAVDRNATNAVKGFLGLVPGGATIFANLQETGALDNAFTWLSGEWQALGLNWGTLKALLDQVGKEFGPADLLDPMGALQKLKNIFMPMVRKVTAFAGTVGKKALEFVLEGGLRLAGSAGAQVLDLLKQSGSAFMQIVTNPIGFAGNLIKGVKLGIGQFAGNADEHLKTGLAGWLFGTLQGAGLTLPSQLNFKGILSLGLQILGVTWQSIRLRLVKAFGEAKVKKLETTVDVIQRLATGGFDTLLDSVMEKVEDFTDGVLAALREWVQSKVVKSAITKIASMFNPAGALIQSLMALYNTVMFFIERASQIAELVKAVVGSIAQIAAGNVASAANFIEQSMAKAVPVLLGFLSRFLGLGNIADAIKKVIARIQKPVELAMDKVVNALMGQVKGLLERLSGGKDKKGLGEAGAVTKDASGGDGDTRTEAKKKLDLDAAVAATERLMSAPGVTLEAVNAKLPGLKDQYQLTRLELVKSADHTFQVFAKINPEKVGNKIVIPLSEADDAWEAAWMAKRKEVEAMFSGFVPKFQALDPNATVHIRGSLATGLRHKEKTTNSGERTVCNPEDFDIDAYIVSDTLLDQAKAASPDRAKVTSVVGSKSGIPKLIALIKEVRAAQATISGNRSTGPESFKFNIILRSKTDAEHKQREDRRAAKGTGFSGDHMNVPAPKVT